MKHLIILALAFMTAYHPASAQDKISGITVQGEGIVKVKPDRVQIKVRVEEEGDSAQEVKTKTDRTIKEVLQFLKEQKVPDTDYKTDFVNLNKKYDYNTKETHYVSQQAISIQLNDIDQYATVINGLMQSGINRIDGVTFENSQIEKHQQEARRKAALNAKQKAEDYARALGAAVGSVSVISEQSVSSPGPVIRMAAYSAADSAGSGDPGLAVGLIEIKENIQVKFNLQ